MALKISKKAKGDVAIIMGSSNDLPCLKEAVDTLKKFKVSVEVEVVSAHRSPEFMQDYAKAARARGIKVIIAAAGGAAHLPGMVASMTTLPVIGVPVAVGKLDGLDALVSIAQMPKGIPVACVAIENSMNAALLALRILSVTDEKIAIKLLDYEKSLRHKVEKMQKVIRRKK